jgi:hypothetical protein
VLDKEVEMARPLTKTKSDGTPYRRPSEVETRIDQVLRLTPSLLLRRLSITDRDHPSYLSSEVLVHLLREEFRRWRKSGDQGHMQALLQALLSRCEAILLVKVPDGALPNASDVRQKILDDLLECFVQDGAGSHPDELDLYECKFNLAFRALRIDAVRSALRRRAKEVPMAALGLPEESGASDADEEVLARISEELCLPPAQEGDAFRAALLEAIEALPDDERRAVTLVHVLGYQEESDDPREITAATLSSCTGRTIRNRLKRAAAKLARFIPEDL